MRFLDNVLQDYIDRAPDEMARAKYSASRERSVGLGVMGFPQLPPGARPRHLRARWRKAGTSRSSSTSASQVDQASMMLAQRARPVPRRRRHGRDGALLLQDGDRADRVDFSIICRRHFGACIEPDPGQYLHPQDALGQLHRSKIPTSRRCWSSKAKNSDAVWSSILEKRRQRRSTSISSRQRKRICFKTSFEIDQRWLLELAADRTPYIDQAAVAEPVHPGGCREMGPDDAPLSAPGNSASNRSTISARKSLQRAGLRWRRRGRQHRRSAQVFELSAESDRL